MDHIAIMKKSWRLIPKILKAEKTIESRWYKSKIAPWDKIKIGDSIYFKDSGEPVTVKAKVVKVEQYEILNNNHDLEIMKKYAEKDLGTNNITSKIRKYIFNKKYAIFIFFDSVQKIKPFYIDKSGFGTMCAWISIENIDRIKKDN